MAAVDIFVENKLRRSVQNGRHNFLNLVSEVLGDAGLEPNFRLMRERTDFDATNLSLIHMKEPVSPNGLVFRCVYHAPFWQIERTEKRWEWQVARDAFDPDGIHSGRAARFQENWRNRLFPDLEASMGDTIYVPLQGLLLKHRSFQSCSPIDMMRSVLAATDRPVVFGLHPNEHYSETELTAVQNLVASYKNASLTKGNMDKILPNCRLVITQNSAVAFNGYLFNKPAVLFGRIDFHHIAEQATPKTLNSAMDRAMTVERDYSKYLWWFWQIKSINAGRPEAKGRIVQTLKALGWPVG